MGLYMSTNQGYRRIYNLSCSATCYNPEVFCDVGIANFSSPVDADFFVTGIAPNFAGVGYSFSPCFLRPFVHLVLILEESIRAKDVAACKGCRCHV